MQDERSPSLEEDFAGEEQGLSESRRQEEEWAEFIRESSRVGAGRSSPSVRFALDDSIPAHQTADISGGPKLYVAVMEAMGLIVNPGTKVREGQYPWARIREGQYP
jgi:hypothetical protein